MITGLNTRISNFSLLPHSLIIFTILLLIFPTLIYAQDAPWTKVEGHWKQELDGFFGSIAINPNDTEVVYIGNTNGGGIYKTVDGGHSWIEINSGLPQLRFTSNYFPIGALVIDPTSPSTLYAGISARDPYSVPNLMGRGIYKSVNAGASWSEANGSRDSPLCEAPSAGVPPIFVIRLDPQKSGTLYAGLRFRGIWKSIDGGNNWTELNNGLNKDPMRGLDIDVLAVDPVNTNVVYAAGNVTDIFQYGPISQGIYKSIDAGNSWAKLNTGTVIKPIPYTALVSSLTVNPNNPSILYFATTSKGIYKSMDGGITWSETNGVGNNKLPKNPVPRLLGYFPIKSLVIDPLLPDTIYAGLISAGVYKSVDGGTNWLPFNEGLNNATVRTLAFALNSSSHMLYAATNKGVFKVSLSGDVRGYVKDSTTNQPINETLIELYHENGNYTGKYTHSKSPNGHFKIRNVPIGNYYLTITKSGYSSTRDPTSGTFYLPTTQEEQGVPEEYWGLNRGDVYLTALLPKPVITSSLQILEFPPFYVGDTITSVFTITNKGEIPITFDVLTVGGRGPEGETDVHDFDWHYGITLNPNESYNYRGNLTLTKARKHHFFPTYRTPDGKWNSSIPVEEAIISTLDIEVTTPSAHQAKIQLKDKSIIKGEIRQEKIKMRTKYGEMDIPTKNFISIIGELIKLKDGTTLKGNFAEKVLNVKTDYGKLKLQTKDIDSIIFVKEPEPPSKPEGPLPEFHGSYLVTNGKLIELERRFQLEISTLQAAFSPISGKLTKLKQQFQLSFKSLSGIDILDPGGYIIFYQEYPPTLYKLVTLAKLYYDEHSNRWEIGDEIELKTAPVKRNGIGAYKLIPSVPLSPGVYTLVMVEYLRIEMFDFSVNYRNSKEYLIFQAQKHYKLGIFYTEKSQYDNAIKEFKKAIEIRPESRIPYYYHLGFSYYNRKMYDEAITTFKKVLQLWPGEVWPHEALYMCYYDKKMYDEAIVELKNLLQTGYRKPASIHYDLARCYYEKKMYDEAIAEVNKSLELLLKSKETNQGSYRKQVEGLLQKLRTEKQQKAPKPEEGAQEIAKIEKVTSNVALGKPVSVTTNGAEDSLSYAGKSPSDITDGSLDYRPASAVVEDGCIGWSNDDYNETMVIIITIDLQETYNITRIRYNPGNVQRAGSWNADIMESLFGRTPTNPGSSYLGAWTEHTGNITASTVTVKFEKSPTTGSWLFIGEIEVWGTAAEEKQIEAEKQYKFEEKRHGGMLLRLEADFDKLRPGISPREAITQNINSIKNRLKAYDDPNAKNIFIYAEDTKRIRIQFIGGLRNPRRLLDLIGRTGRLEFRLVDEKGDLNKALQGDVPGDDQILYDSKKRPYLLKKETLLSGSAIKDARVEMGQWGQPYISLEFKSEAVDKWAEITGQHVEERIAIILDNVIKSAPVVKSRILQGKCVIEGNFTTEEAQDIATIIKSGSLAVPLNIIQNTTWAGDAASSFSRGYVFHVKPENPIPPSSFRDLREVLNSNGMRQCMVQTYGRKEDNLYMIWIDLRGISAEINKEADKETTRFAQEELGLTDPITLSVQQTLKEEILAKILSQKLEEILYDRKGQIRSVNIIEQVKG